MICANCHEDVWPKETEFCENCGAIVCRYCFEECDRCERREDKSEPMGRGHSRPAVTLT